MKIPGARTIEDIVPTLVTVSATFWLPIEVL